MRMGFEVRRERKSTALRVSNWLSTPQEFSKAVKREGEERTGRERWLDLYEMKLCRRLKYKMETTTTLLPPLPYLAFLF